MSLRNRWLCTIAAREARSVCSSCASTQMSMSAALSRSTTNPPAMNARERILAGMRSSSAWRSSVVSCVNMRPLLLWRQRCKKVIVLPEPVACHATTVLYVVHHGHAVHVSVRVSVEAQCPAHPDGIFDEPVKRLAELSLPECLLPQPCYRFLERHASPPL